jgi:hypothetical protein
MDEPLALFHRRRTHAAVMHLPGKSASQMLIAKAVAQSAQIPVPMCCSGVHKETQ